MWVEKLTIATMVILFGALEVDSVEPIPEDDPRRTTEGSSMESEYREERKNRLATYMY